MTDSLVDASDGFDRILQALDNAFKYDSRVEMPRALERFFYQLTRKSEMTMLQYCSEHRELLREIEKFEIKIPSSVSGWLLLRRSNLTQEQKHLVQAQVGPELDMEKVESVLYYLFGQDYKTKAERPAWNKNKLNKSRWYPAKKSQAYTAEEFDPEDYEADPEETFLQADEEVFEDDFNPEEYEDPDLAHGTFEEEAYGEEWLEEGSDPQFEEAYATYLDARRQLANIKASRGYYPVVALTSEFTSSTSPSSQRPVVKGGKGKKGKGKGK